MKDALITPRLLTVEELSVYLGMPKATIYTKKCRGEFPSGCVVKLDGKTRFDKQEIDKWIDEHKS